MSDAILVFNAGSTSVKFGAYRVDGSGSLTLISHGEVDGMECSALHRQERSGQDTGYA